jgi:rhodanese-related sulfurtransferase
MMKTLRALVDEAMAQVTTCSIDEARALHDSGGARFVDIRESIELEREGRIPGALHVPRGLLEFAFDPASPWHRVELNGDLPVVLFCGIGWRSALAAKTLLDMGHARIAHLGGGYAAWRQAGAPTDPWAPPAAD